MAAGAGLQLGAMARPAAGRRTAVDPPPWLPLAAWLLARLFGLDAMQTTILLVFSSMPTASSAYVLAARMGYDGPWPAPVTLSTLLGWSTACRWHSACCGQL